MLGRVRRIGLPASFRATHAVVSDFLSEANRDHAASMLTTNYKGTGEAFKNFVRCYPLADSADPGRTSAMLGVLYEPGTSSGPR